MKYGNKSEGLLKSIHGNVFILLIVAQLRRMSWVTKEIEKVVWVFAYRPRMFGRIGFLRNLLKERLAKGRDEVNSNYGTF